MIMTEIDLSVEVTGAAVEQQRSHIRLTRAGRAAVALAGVAFVAGGIAGAFGHQAVQEQRETAQLRTVLADDELVLARYTHGMLPLDKVTLLSPQEESTAWDLAEQVSNGSNVSELARNQISPQVGEDGVQVGELVVVETALIDTQSPNVGLMTIHPRVELP
jgi:hypothetical protein